MCFTQITQKQSVGISDLKFGLLDVTEKNATSNLQSFRLSDFDLVGFKDGYVTYEGSLTTPPCSEAVTWLIQLQPIEATRQQVYYSILLSFYDFCNNDFFSDKLV